MAMTLRTKKPSRLHFGPISYNGLFLSVEHRTLQNPRFPLITQRGHEDRWNDRAEVEIPFRSFAVARQFSLTPLPS